MTLMKAYLSVSLFLLYDTNEGQLNIITVHENSNNLKYTFISDIQDKQ
jgi:hypothetical protein